MASEYTPNRRYPLYTDNDKPNLRDQYNGAIREIDTDMAQALSDSSAVSAALGAGFDAQHTVRMSIDGIGTSITNESTARQSADTALDTRIDNEVSARQSADTALGTRITNETTARESADTALGTRITNETTARESADTALDGRIDDLESTITLSGYKAIIYGDSTMVETAQGSTALGSLIADVTGMNIANRAVSGTDIANFLTLMNNAGTSDFVGYDFVFMAYCTNDWQSGTTIWDGMYATTDATFHDRLAAAFDRLDSIRGTCRPVFVTPAYAKNPNLNTLANAALNTNAVGNTLENYIDCVLIECRKRGYGVIDLFHTMGVSESNYAQLFTRSSYDPSHEWYNVYVHYSQVLKNRIARAFLDYFPYIIPAIEKNDTVNKLVNIYKSPLGVPSSHSANLNSRVPMVSCYDKASGNLIIEKQYANGRNTLSFYVVGFTGRLQINHKDNSGNIDEVRSWKLTKSGHYDIYIDDLFGYIDMYFVPDENYHVRVCNLMLTDGHNSYPNYTMPTGCTIMKHSPSSWSNKGDATKVYSQVSGNSLNIYFDRFTTTSECTASQELMVIGNANMNVSRASVIVPMYTSADNWHYIGLTFAQKDNGISVMPQNPIPSGAMIDALVSIPIISMYMSNEEW